MDPLSRRAKPPAGLGRSPPGMPGEREIELLRLVRMGGIFDVAAEQQNAAGDRVALERPALTDPFAPAVVLQEVARRNRRWYRSAASRDRRPARRRLRPARVSRAQRDATGLRGRQRPEASARLAAGRSRRAASRGGRATLQVLPAREDQGGRRRGDAGSWRSGFCPAWDRGAARCRWTLSFPRTRESRLTPPRGPSILDARVRGHDKGSR